MENTKKRGRLRTLCIVLAAVWVVLFAADTLAVMNWKKPVFSVCLRGADDGGSGTYVGLGYWFELHGNFMPDAAPGSQTGVTKAEGRVFGIWYLNRER